MPKQKSTDKLATLHEKMRQLQAQAAAIEARQKEQTRKDDTRRKVIAGALALEHMAANAGSDFAATLNRLLDEYVKRPSDRALFPDLPEATGKAGTNGHHLPANTMPLGAGFNGDNSARLQDD